MGQVQLRKLSHSLEESGGSVQLLAIAKGLIRGFPGSSRKVVIDYVATKVFLDGRERLFPL
jgi:hypothetical protein